MVAVRSPTVSGIVSTPSVCMWCHSHCKVLVHVKDGRLLGLEGDARAPRGGLFQRTVAGCPRARAGGDWAHHPERVAYPQKRIGARGENRWQRISWKDAFDEIAGRLSELKARHGARTVATTSGTYRSPDEYRRRFFYRLGSANCFSQGHICWAVSNVVSAALSGLSCNAFTPYPGVTRCMLLVGTNPACSERTSWRQIRETKEAGARLIVLDPRRTETAKLADVHLQVRAGTDLAVLLAMIHVLAEENLVDREFVSEWCHGFDELASHVEKYTPEWAAGVAGVEAALIREAARLYGSLKPATVASYLGVDQVTNSVQALHARYILTALTGNLDVKGGEMGRPPTQGYVTEFDVEDYSALEPERKEEQLGARRFPLLGWPGYDLIQGHVQRVWARRMTSSHHMFAHAPTVFRAILSGEPYPVTAMLTMANNPLLTYANSKLILDALMALDLYVVADPFMTPSARLADYVLPTGNWLERPVLFTGSDTAGFIVGGPAALPTRQEGLFERRTDYDIWMELGRRMGQAEAWPWGNLEEAYDHRLSPLGMTFSQFVEQGGHLNLRGHYRPFREVGFGTKTGKFELYSTVLEQLGHAPLPAWEEPSESPVSTPDAAGRYPLILTTGGRFSQAYHSEHRQVKSLRRNHPDPLVQIHPATAGAQDIATGDRVWLESARGRIRMKAVLTADIREDTVHAEHGWWFPEQPGEAPHLHGVFESNVNVLTDDDPDRCNAISGGWGLRALLCRIYK